MIAAIVGMTGSGKSTVSDMFAKNGFGFIRLGQITLDIIKERGLPPTEENERPIREGLRKKHGMAAYATLNFPKIDALREKGNVVMDGLYSWEEFIEFSKRYGDDFVTIAVYSSPKTRYARLSARKFDKGRDELMRFRPNSEPFARDQAEIENISKAGPIVMADYTLINEGTIAELESSVRMLLSSLSC
jgi:dephospho-CoA kinase